MSEEPTRRFKTLTSETFVSTLLSGQRVSLSLANVSKLPLASWSLPGDGWSTQRLCRGWVFTPLSADWMPGEDT